MYSAKLLFIQAVSGSLIEAGDASFAGCEL
jgi:hypothetical protein